jgi:sigma-54 dependent transcriptional regulator, acetoin dehydrogenase operon transcriptional activator AcoR
MPTAWPTGASPRSRPWQAAGSGTVTAVAGVHPAHAAAIAQSHERCVALGLSRIESPDSSPLGRSDLSVALDRHRRLCAHAAPVMAMLHQQIINTGSMVALTDATGTILHSIGDDDFLGKASKVALQPGANWSEPSKGTNAVGTALIDERPTLVHAEEHFMHANHFLTCSAAPILDPHGNILGALDVSGDQRSFHPHTMALVTMSVRMIENHWLTDDGAQGIRLHFHPRLDHIGTLLEGILTLGPDGSVSGANRSAMELLGLSGVALRHQSLRSLFGLSLEALMDHLNTALAPPITVLTADGRAYHLHAQGQRALRVPVALHAPNVPPGPPPPSRPAVAMPRTDLRSTALPAHLPSRLDDWLTGDPQMAGLVAKLRRVLDLDIHLLLQGETGTGKEWLARTLHAESNRAHEPFVTLSCAGQPEAALETALWGQGGSGQVGKLLQVGAGTLFVDQVGDMPPAFQGRWLRLLQERQFCPAGSNTPQPLQATLICAHRSSLRALVEQGLFRDDLYYLLNGLSVRLPALHQRQDVLVMAQRLLEQHAGPQAPALSPAVKNLLQHAPWPGNVRQLSNALRAAAVMAAGQASIELNHLPDDLQDEACSTGWTPEAPHASAQRAVNAATTSASGLGQSPADLPLAQVLAQAGGNVSEAARRLGLSRNTLYRRLRQIR